MLSNVDMTQQFIFQIKLTLDKKSNPEIIRKTILKSEPDFDIDEMLNL